MQRQQDKLAKQSKIPVEAALGVTKKKSAVLNEVKPNVSAASAFGTGPFAGAAGANGQNKKPEGADHMGHESIEEKKERLFKWNAYQTVKFG